MSFFQKKRGEAKQARPQLESLEAREVLYAVTGNAWVMPERVTISFVPDGTLLPGGETSNLFSSFNTRFGSTSAWQTPMLKAAQLWAQQTNLNFSVVLDDGAETGSGLYVQGASNFGDIRIGGYNFGNSALAVTASPPPVNSASIAGDIQFNTGQTFNVGSTFDLFTVATHEIGHALGLGHSAFASANMYANYNGTKTALTTDDINGIRATYSAGTARRADGFDLVAANGNFAAASNLTSRFTIDDPLRALVTGLDITTTTDADFYTVTVPTGTNGTFRVMVQSANLSLLNLRLTVYNGGQTQVFTGSQGGTSGGTINATLNNVSAGQVYYLKVQGMDTTAMSTGAYALSLNFGPEASLAITPPNTQVLNGIVNGGGGGMDALPGGTNLLVPGESESEPFHAFYPEGEGDHAHGHEAIASIVIDPSEGHRASADSGRTRRARVSISTAKPSEQNLAGLLKALDERREPVFARETTRTPTGFDRHESLPEVFIGPRRRPASEENFDALRRQPGEGEDERPNLTTEADAPLVENL